MLPELEVSVQEDIDSNLIWKYLQMVQGLLWSWEDVRELELEGEQDYISWSFQFGAIFHQLYICPVDTSCVCDEALSKVAVLRPEIPETHHLNQTDI